MLNNLLKIHLIRAIQKNVKATGDLIDNKITNTIREVSKIYHRIIHKRLQRNKKILGLIQKYPGKDIYLQKKRQQIINHLKLMS